MTTEPPSSPPAEEAPPPGAADGRRVLPGVAPRARSPLKYYLGLLLVGFGLILLGDELGFFLFLMLMGAALSYLGDQLGAWCGKNRMSILGLRPKYTANVINLFTGLLITTMTLFGAGYMSENVRIALFRVRELRSEARGLRQDVDRVKGELAGLRQLYDENQALSIRLEAAKKDLDEQNAALRGVNRDLDRRNSELLTANLVLEKERQDLETRREALNKSIQEKLREIDRLNLALEKKETVRVAIARGQVLLDETVAVPMDVSTAALAGLVAEVAEKVQTTVELLDVKFDDQAVRDLSDQGTRAIAARLAEIRAYYEGALSAGKITRLPAECHFLPVSTRNVAVGEQLSRVGFEVLPNLVVFTRGEEVARTLVEKGLSEERIIDQLLYFDKQVRTLLRDKGVSATAARKGAAPTSSARLLELVQLAQHVHGTEAAVVVRCRVASDVLSFGEPHLTFEIEGSTPGDRVAAALGRDRRERPGNPGEGDEIRSEGLALVLPEPDLSSKALRGGWPLVMPSAP